MTAESPFYGRWGSSRRGKECPVLERSFVSPAPKSSRHLHSLLSLLCALIVFLSCSGFSLSLPPQLAPLWLPSYEGDVQATHPSVLYFDTAWNDYHFWIAYSPYPQGDDRKENPHLLASNDGVHWQRPAGFCNPLDGTPEGYQKGVVYNSDPELVYNSDTDELECWWRYVNDSLDQMILYRRRSGDGVYWTEKECMLQTVRSQDDRLSPTLLYENGVYRMWSVGGDCSVQYNEYSPGTGWSATRSVALRYSSDTLSSWHLTVRHTEKGYEMLMAASDANATPYPRSRMSLYYACSKDGKDFGTAERVFSPRKGSWFNRGLYRPAFAMVNGKYYVYFSGISGTNWQGIGLLVGEDIHTLRLCR